MGHSPAQGRLARVLAAAAALTLVAAAPAGAAGDPPAKAKRAKAETRYCIYRHRAGAAVMEKYCRTRDQWIAEYGVDPIRHLK